MQENYVGALNCMCLKPGKGYLFKKQQNDPFTVILPCSKTISYLYLFKYLKMTSWLKGWQEENINILFVSV